MLRSSVQVRHRAVLGTAPVDQVVLAVERLAGRAVEARVRALVEVAALAHALDEALHERLVLGIRRADEEVVRAPRCSRASSRKRSATGSAHCLRRDARGRGGLRDLGAVLVGAGEEERVVAARRAWRVATSAAIVVYAWPRCGSALT